MYHKCYQEPEPITIVIRKDGIEIQSIPGPDRSISDENLERLELRSHTYRNKRLCDFLKGLDLTEGMNTGIPNICNAMEWNGSSMPIHPDFLPIVTTDESDDSTGRRDSETLKKDVLEVLRREGRLTSGTLSRKLGYSKITGLFHSCLNELMESGHVTYEYPDNPRHPKQRCVTSGDDHLLTMIQTTSSSWTIWSIPTV